MGRAVFGVCVCVSLQQRQKQQQQQYPTAGVCWTLVKNIRSRFLMSNIVVAVSFCNFVQSSKTPEWSNLVIASSLTKLKRLRIVYSK